MSTKDFLKGREHTLNSKLYQPVGIGGFTAFASVNETIDYASELPQFALEDGSVATDHIINKPVVIKISGEVGAKFIRVTPPNPLLQQVEKVSGLAQSLIPGYNGAMLSKAIAIKSQAEDFLDKIDNIADTFSGFLSSDNKPDYEVFLDFIESIYNSKIPIDVIVKNRQYEKMSIKTLTIRTDNISNVKKFDLTVQKLDFRVLAEADISAYFSKPANDSGAGGDSEKGSQNLDGKKNESLLNSIFR